MSDSEERNATDVLIDLERKVDTLLQLISNVDLNNKLISNKLNSLILKVESQQSTPKPEVKNNHPTIETESFQPKVFVEKSPSPNRRISRQEPVADPVITFGQKEPEIVLNQKNKESIPEVVTPPTQEIKELRKDTKEFVFDDVVQNVQKNVIPISQTVMKNCKAVFMADVEIINESNEVVKKTRTNGVGKWQAALPVGNYKISVKPKDGSKEAKTMIINVDGKMPIISLSEFKL